MRVEIDKIHIDIYKSIAKDINRSAKKFKIKSHKFNSNTIEKALFNTNISVEEKKKELSKYLRKVIIKTFSVDITTIRSKNALLDGLRNNLFLLRAIVDKLRSINYYLEENFMRELKLLKKNKLYSIDLKNNKILNKDYLGKKDLEKLEHIVYRLIEKVIFLDKKLLKGYKKKEEIIIKTKSQEIKNLDTTLRKESEILMHLESKFPPPKKANIYLLSNKVVYHWITRIFALLSVYEFEIQKEELIFKKLKRNEKLRKKINEKIKYILKEKEELLRIQEQRALSMKKLKVDKEWRLIFHQFNAASRI